MTFVLGKPKIKNKGHTRAKAPDIRLDQPGRLRICHLLSLFSISHSALYSGFKKGKYPPADGSDGRPFWRTDTLRRFLKRQKQ